MVDNKNLTDAEQQEVVDLYRSVSNEEPSAQLDAKIIALAKSNIKTLNNTDVNAKFANKPRVTAFLRYRFQLASAASVLFVAILFWQTQPPVQQTSQFPENNQTVAGTSQYELADVSKTTSEEPVLVASDTEEPLAVTASRPEMLMLEKMVFTDSQTQGSIRMRKDAQLLETKISCEQLVNKQEVTGSLGIVEIGSYLAKAGMLQKVEQWSEWDKKHIFVLAQQRTPYTALIDESSKFSKAAKQVIAGSQFELDYQVFAALVSNCY